MPEHKRAEESTLDISVELIFRVAPDRYDDRDAEQEFGEDADQAVDHRLVRDDDVDAPPGSTNQRKRLDDVGGKPQAAYGDFGAL